MKHTAWHYLIFGLLLAWQMLNNNSMQRKLDQMELQIKHLAGIAGRLNDIVEQVE